MQQIEESNPKIVILGQQGVGKTSFANRLLNADLPYKPTTGINFITFTSKKQPDKNTKTIYIFDTSNEDRFKSIVYHYCENSYLILVFNINNASSFDKLNSYLTALKGKRTTNLVLIGTHIDNKESREVTFEDAQRYATTNNMRYFEVSATHSKDDEFDSILNYIIENTHTILGLKLPKFPSIYKKYEPENNEYCNFILNLLINLANICTLFIPYLFISKCVTHKQYYKENQEIRGNYFAFYGKNIQKEHTKNPDDSRECSQNFS